MTTTSARYARRFALLLGTCAAAALLALPARADSKPSGPRYQAFATAGEEVRDQDIRWQDQAAQLTALYAKTYGGRGAETPEQLQAMPIDELRELLYATYETVFYTNDRNMAQRLAVMTAAAQKRTRLSEDELEQPYTAFVQTRQFKQAAQWSAANPTLKLEALPALRDALPARTGQLTELHISPKGNTLERRAVALPAGPHVIAIGHPLCGFSARSHKALRDDPQLSAAFKGKIKWIAPQNGHLNVDVLRDWNRDNPDAPLTIAYQQSEWADIPAWHTPTFYFFNGGKLVATVEGWPAEGSKGALVDGLKKIGAWTVP